MSAAPPASQATPAVSMIATLGIVSTVCGAIIVAAYEGTYDAAAANRRLALERTVFRVIPGAKSMVEFQADAKGVAPAEGASASEGAVKFYATYDAGGGLAGIAVEAAARGYADVVRILYAYAPSCQCISGIGVVSMKETPGIGDKIITDREFLANFQALDVKLSQDLKALANEVRTVKHGSKTKPWEIDAISGATITSRAVGKAINDSAQILLPRLVPELDALNRRSS
jgi:electron transport complex protein RnfG